MDYFEICESLLYGMWGVIGYQNQSEGWDQYTSKENPGLSIQNCDRVKKEVNAKLSQAGGLIVTLRFLF